ncbi:hypothetical protein DL768_000154 [Monosporascus sp. mg162]|nr:hypothetical protein DL768_000154 [Monosporascus sp. mg162]
MTPFKNILLIGASGSIGSVVFEALQQEPSFILTVLQRHSSKAKLPSHLRVTTIADSYPTDELVAAFTGQDVIVNCMTSLSVADQFRMVDAAIAAGALNSVFHDKGKVQEYLRTKAEEGAIEWMSISCVSALKKPEETKNTNIYLSDFAITQKQLLEAIEKAQGVKYKTESVDSQVLIEEKQEAVQEGDQTAIFALIETGFVTGRFGGHLEKEPGRIMNEQLGLPNRTLDEVVATALRSLGQLIIYRPPHLSKPKVLSTAPLSNEEAVWTKLVKIEYRDPKGKTRLWESAERRTRPQNSDIDGVGILAVVEKPTGPEIILQKQYRPPLDKVCVEVPAGLIDEGETAEEAAVRELKEETGYVGKVTETTPMMFNDPGFCNTNLRMVHVTIDMNLPENQDLRPELEENEFIEVFLVPLTKLYEECKKLEAEGYAIDARVATLAEGIEVAKQFKL